MLNNIFIKKKINIHSSWVLISKVKYFHKCERMKLNVSEKLESEIINLPSNPKHGS